MIEEKMRFFLVGIGFGATAFYLFWAALREYRSAILVIKGLLA